LRSAAALDGLGLDVLWERLRDRAEAGGSLDGSMQLTFIGEAESRALARLLGRRRSFSASSTLQLSELDAALMNSRLGVSLRQALEGRFGDLRDRPAERAAEAAALDAFWAGLTGHLALTLHPPLGDWLGGLRRVGWLRRHRGERPEQAIEAALGILAGLPSPGTLRTHLAASATGDAHALDPGQPLAELVVRALAHLEQVPAPESALARRRLWERWGVDSDSISSLVKVLNLPATGDGLVPQMLREFAAAGEPCVLTLSMLRRKQLRFEPAEVFACENPSVLESAARALGSSSQPLICFEGQNMATSLLGEALRASVCRIRYHGDFDWGGVRLGNIACARLGAIPWRFGADDYRAALAAGTRLGPLEGRPVTPSWDAHLRAAMQEAGAALQEEEQTSLLLKDLAQPPASR